MRVIEDYKLQHVEVSDGSITIPHAEKCGYIEKLAKKVTVFSEVGSKDAAHIMPPYKWIELMRAELEAGASYVIAEAREAGNVGIYRGSGRGTRRPGTGNPYPDTGGESTVGGAAESTAGLLLRAPGP